MNALIQQIVGEARFDGDPEDIQMVQPPPAPGHQNALTAVLGGPPHATSGTEESREVEIGKSMLALCVQIQNRPEECDSHAIRLHELARELIDMHRTDNSGM